MIVIHDQLAKPTARLALTYDGMLSVPWERVAFGQFHAYPLEIRFTSYPDYKKRTNLPS